MPRKLNRGDNRGNTQTVQPTAIEELPIECWVSIFEFLDMKEMKRISCWISPQVSQNLLESEYNQIFYRRLCEEQLKNELNKVIDTIQSSERPVQTRRRGRDQRRSLPNINSMKELREYLRVCVLKSKWLFSHWYTEDVSLDDRIYENVKFSYCLNIHKPTSRLIELQGYSAVENIKKVAEMKAKSFMKEIQEQVVKQSKRPFKWKSIWNGHFIWSTHSNLKYTTQEFEHRFLHHTSITSVDVFNYLQTTYNGLMALTPEIRRNVMFKMVTFTYKLKFNGVREQSFFSKLVSNIFHSGCGMDLSLQNLYEKLIDLFVEESIQYGVKTPILLDGFYEKCSPLHLILRTNCKNLSVNLLWKYREMIIENSSKEFKFFLFVSCFKNKVNLKVIESLFRRQIINSEIIEEFPLSTYFMNSINKQCKNADDMYYYYIIYNLVAQSFKNSKGSYKILPINNSEITTLDSVDHPKFKEFLLEASKFRINRHSLSKYTNFFTRQICRIVKNNPKQDKQKKPNNDGKMDDRAVCDYLHFGKSRFATF